VQLLPRLRHKMARHVLPARRLRVNRREIKQIYKKYKPKKRQCFRLNRSILRISSSILSICSILLHPRFL